VILTALVLALPVLVVFGFVFQPAGEVWRHLADTVLKDYVSTPCCCMLGVGLGTLFGGVGQRLALTHVSVPGRGLFEWALILPMAMPAYIIAYTYTGMLDFAGPVQTGLRELFGWSYGDYWFPEIRSLGGAIVMLSLVLYPYVYLLSAPPSSSSRSACWRWAAHWAPAPGPVSSASPCRWHARR
jgi:iron(III) transport system permease protein